MHSDSSQNTQGKSDTKKRKADIHHKRREQTPGEVKYGTIRDTKIEVMYDSTEKVHVQYIQVDMKISSEKETYGVRVRDINSDVGSDGEGDVDRYWKILCRPK